MRELIVSKDVREYLQEKQYYFTDYERATLIYNSAWPIQEKYLELLELINATKDMVLVQQIRERISWDNACIDRIENTIGDFVYHLKVWEQEDGHYQSAGYFVAYSTAKKHATRSDREYMICVIELENTVEWNEENWGDSEKAYIKYNEKNEVIEYWERDYTEPCNMTDEGRFEFAYVLIPYPFIPGEIVKVIGTDEVGIVRFCGNQEDENRKGGQNLDYSDTYITIEVLCEDTAFMHEHISPLDLEYTNLSCDDLRKELLESASYLVTGQGYIQEFQMVCEKYIKEYEKRPQR